jgi:putative ABC transport system permease protein
LRVLTKRFEISKKLLLILAFKELRHDWKATGVLLCVIVSIVTPLLILYGLKQGVINTQREILLNDPCNLEIKMSGHYRLSDTWFEQMAKDPRIQFIIPITRFLNTDITIIDKENKSRSVDLIPTAFGDPLLNLAGIQTPEKDNEVLITHALAKRLHINKGEQLQAQLFRTVENQSQTSHTLLTVKNILPDYSCLQRTAALTTLNFLESVEDFKEGQPVNLFEVEEEKKPTKMPLQKKITPNKSVIGIFDNTFPSFFEPLIKNNKALILEENIDNLIIDSLKKTKLTATSQMRASYAKARIFAKSIDDIPILSDELRSSSEEIEVISKAIEIEKLKKLNYFLNIILLTVSLIGVVGGGLALGGNFLLTIDRKRLQIAQLRLLGIGKKNIAFFLWIQAIIITSSAFMAATLLSFVTKIVLAFYTKAILGDVIQVTNSEVKIFYLSWHDYLLAYACTLVFSSIVIVMGTKRANSIEAGEQLREI